jgi:predicted HAD superfamily Cof-like phosphohydrolase
LYKNRLDFLSEEVEELHQAISDDDKIEYRDALADMLYIAYGTADILAIDIDFAIVEHIYSYNELLSFTVNNFTRTQTNCDLLRGRYVPLPPSVYEDQYRGFIKEFEDIESSGKLYELENLLVRFIVHTYCHALSMGIDIDKDFDAVHTSNMTKFCKTLDEVEKSIKLQLETKGRECYHIYNSEHKLYVIKIKGSDKITKGINYEPPVLN